MNLDKNSIEDFAGLLDEFSSTDPNIVDVLIEKGDLNSDEQIHHVSKKNAIDRFVNSRFGSLADKGQSGRFKQIGTKPVRDINQKQLYIVTGVVYSGGAYRGEAAFKVYDMPSTLTH